MKLERQLGILAVLMKNKQVTAPYLAEIFEVSRRTVNRDIESLCMAGIPVVSKQGGGGGFSIAEGYKLENGVFTSNELASILAGLRGIGSVSEGKDLGSTLHKLLPADEALIPAETMLIDLASHYKGSLTGKIAAIRAAIAQKKLLSFLYYSEKGRERRVVEPYYVVYQWTSWYLIGYCTMRESFRMFKLARLWELEALSDAFTPRPVPPEALDFGARFQDERRLTALFDPSVRHLIIETYGPNCYDEQPSGMLLFSCGYTNKSHMLAWLLSFGHKVKVLEPSELAGEVACIAQKTAALYKGT